MHKFRAIVRGSISCVSPPGSETKKIAVKIQKNLNCEYISFVTVGNEVPHAHIHIIPQWSGTLEGFHFGDVVATEKIELEKLAEKLIK